MLFAGIYEGSRGAELTTLVGSHESSFDGRGIIAYNNV